MAHIIGTVSLNKNVYSLRDIAQYEHISDEKIECLMSDTLKMAVRSSELKTAAGIQAFFNEIGVYDSMINRFIYHTKLKPFAYAIRLQTEKCYKGNKEVYYIMFCVSKEIYDKWHKKQIPYRKDIQPEMSKSDEIKEKAASRRVISLKKCPELEHFEKSVEKIGVKLNEAVMLALNEYMKNHSNVFGKIPSTEIKENRVLDNKMSLICAYIDPMVTNQVYKVLQRYNQVNVPRVKFSEFVEAALREKLDRLPIRYTNPELYREQQKLEKAEKEYLDSI